MSKHRILYYEILQYLPEVVDAMEQSFVVTRLTDPGHDTDNILRDVEICMAPLGFPFDRAKIDRCPNLKVIASSTLSVPHIDVEYAAKKGIRVCWLSEAHKGFLATITPTAELTWGLIISITRNIPWAHKDVCDGKWEGRSFGSRTPRMLSNMSLGIVGLGRLGTWVASYGKAFGMEVYYFSPTSRDSDYKRCQTLPELAGSVDIISIHAHHTRDTERMIGAEFLSAMRPGSYLINTARGAIVDEDALLDALENGHLGGAAVDVLAAEFEPDFLERLPQNELVRYAATHQNLIITPHYAGATRDAWEMTQTKTIELIKQALG
ncbi:MAG: hydroxyacid dehydrogenase [Deltaproteobacteria bacterium]|nr:hydroxyacid dehydrogenase [Deltaproteobacteria bacterium]